MYFLLTPEKSDGCDSMYICNYKSSKLLIILYRYKNKIKVNLFDNNNSIPNGITLVTSQNDANSLSLVDPNNIEHYGY